MWCCFSSYILHWNKVNSSNSSANLLGALSHNMPSLSTVDHGSQLQPELAPVSVHHCQPGETEAVSRDSSSLGALPSSASLLAGLSDTSAAAQPPNLNRTPSLRRPPACWLLPGRAGDSQPGDSQQDDSTHSFKCSAAELRDWVRYRSAQSVLIYWTWIYHYD